MKSSPAVLLARHIVLVLFAVAFLIPFVGIVLSALRGDSETGGFQLPHTWTLENFAIAWEQGRFSDLMLSSVIVGAIVVPSTLVLATLAGYGLAVLRPMGHSAIMTTFVIGLTLPTELVIIALYYNLDSVGFTNNYMGVALAEIALFLPFSVYWMHTHFSGVPRALIESGRIDGASDWRILRQLMLPISKPALTTLVVLLSIWAWNQFLIVLVLMQSPTRRTAVAGLGYFVGEYGTDIPLLAAASLIVVAPVVVVYLLFQRSFVAGITQGAIKG
ncbi:carbohydrate ABC transporter permease [Nonomuraea sp. NPDC046570]|uniref:carbohydrate ABC transporter permease n=1 Tax=Nonomuraea sp. NPDC046570 TaxID=3155255 RepID=UPI0033C1C41E